MKTNAAVARTKFSFPEIVSAIIDIADHPQCPGILDPEGPWPQDAVPLEVRVPIIDALETIDGKRANAVFYARLKRIDEIFPDKEMENIVAEMEDQARLLPQTIGFAQGLRAAGMPRDEAVMVLRGYLRRFEEPRE